MQAQAIPEEVFEEHILDREVHARLIADMDHVAHIAGIPKHYIWTRLSTLCKAKEIDWVTQIKRVPEAGICYTGDVVNVHERMMAITGACIRNFIDARMMPVQEVIEKLKKGTMPEPSVLLIPNFQHGKKSGGDVPQWQISSLLGMLYARLGAGQKTIIYVEDATALKTEYGAVFWKHIESHFKLL